MSGATVDVLFTPADFDVLEGRDLSKTVCVVFDTATVIGSGVILIVGGEGSSGVSVPTAEVLQ